MVGMIRLVCLTALSVMVLAAAEPPSLSSGRQVGYDALVWSAAHFYRFEHIGLQQNDFAFERVSSLLGITGTLGQVASARASMDLGSIQPQDLWVDLRWGNEFGIRAGQFLLPLGMDAMTEQRALPLVTSSLMGTDAKPNGTRDIGFLVSWERLPFTLSLAAVNGSGPNRADNNGRKDVCGRVVVRPFSGIGLRVALRAYLGWPGAPDSAWQTAAGEAALETGRFSVQAELQRHSYSAVRDYAGYALLRYRNGLVEPCGRIEWVTPRGQRSDVMIIAGPNVYAIDDHVKVTLDCFYRHNYQTSWAVYGFIFRLQAVI